MGHHEVHKFTLRFQTKLSRPFSNLQYCALTTQRKKTSGIETVSLFKIWSQGCSFLFSSVHFFVCVAHNIVHRLHAEIFPPKLTQFCQVYLFTFYGQSLDTTKWKISYLIITQLKRRKSGSIHKHCHSNFCKTQLRVTTHNFYSLK